MEFKHVSVLLEETIDSLNICPDGIYVDGTTGGGGHSYEIAKLIRRQGAFNLHRPGCGGTCCGARAAGTF